MGPASRLDSCIELGKFLKSPIDHLVTFGGKWAKFDQICDFPPFEPVTTKSLTENKALLKEGCSKVVKTVEGVNYQCTPGKWILETPGLRSKLKKLGCTPSSESIKRNTHVSCWKPPKCRPTGGLCVAFVHIYLFGDYFSRSRSHYCAKQNSVFGSGASFSSAFRKIGRND